MFLIFSYVYIKPYKYIKKKTSNNSFKNQLCNMYSKEVLFLTPKNQYNLMSSNDLVSNPCFFQRI